jgi:hypothetical protein
MIDKALLNLCPNAKWAVGDSIETLRWFDEEYPQPSNETIEAEVARLEEKAIQDKIDADAKVQAAQAKLAKLGLTPDDLKALLG